MVRFLGDPEQYASPAMVQRLDAAIQQSTALAERVSAVAHAVRSFEPKQHSQMWHSLACGMVLYSSSVLTCASVH